jgi:gliding motility-associated-like protein
MQICRSHLHFSLIWLPLFLLVAPGTASAQKQNNQWRFGYSGAISFNSNPPVFVPGAAIFTSEGSASVADRNTGALLFYTDGVTVWNSLDAVMPNGTGLRGGSQALLSSTTAAVIIPKPGNSNQYYIVTIDEGSSGQSAEGLYYNLVDMTLDGGKGDIVQGQKNILLQQTTTEKLEAVPAANGTDYWVVTHNNNEFYSFLLTGSGFQSTPVVSAAGGGLANTAGHLKANGRFDQLACGSLFEGEMKLFRFDNATGQVSDLVSCKLAPVILGFSPLIYGVEFSPNGRLLYVNNLNVIVQYDISQTNRQVIENSAYQLAPADFDQPASMQLAPDGKIYINTGTLDVINCPDRQGAACGYQKVAISSQFGGGGYGLPKRVYYADEQHGAVSNDISVTDSCAGTPFLFRLTGTNRANEIRWFFGDPDSGTGNTASGDSTSHTYSRAGSYVVTAILESNCGADTLVKSVIVANCDTTVVVDCTVSLPNAFTPNSDGSNDQFYPVTPCAFEVYECDVYTRWGQLIFRTTSPTDQWDGTFQGENCLSDVYIYRMSYQLPGEQLQRATGNITLIR